MKQINAWAAAATNNLIDSVLTEQQVSTETDVIVANTVYFKAMWDSPFSGHNTEDDKFYRLDGTAFDVAFMRAARSSTSPATKGSRCSSSTTGKGTCGLRRRRPSPCASSSQSQTSATGSEALSRGSRPARTSSARTFRRASSRWATSSCLDSSSPFRPTYLAFSSGWDSIWRKPTCPT